MTKLLFITGDEIDGQEFNCLGPQLALLIEATQPFLEDCTWFVGDVNTTAGYPHFAPHGEKTCVEVGTTQELIRAVEIYGQFTDGVFIAVPNNRKNAVAGLVVHTEGGEHMHTTDAVVEVRTFDTSYFEVYTASDELYSSLRNRFGGQPYLTDE